MTILKKNFGKLNGKSIDLFTLSNTNGVEVSIMNYGATITSILLPDGEGKTSIACGFDSIDGYMSDEYKANSPYFGCTVGRYCSQIKDAKFELNGTTYQLAKMVGENNLHGGLVGFDKKIWTANVPDESKSVLEMTVKSVDMEEGFPGNVDVKVTFTLTDKNELKIDYKATPDKDTPLAMTNHTYFNLSGFKSDITGHVVKVNTSKLQECDDTGAGTGKILNVTDTINDLQLGRKIGDVHEAIGKGFEHFYVFDNNYELFKTAEIIEPISGRKLEVLTSEPCMLFYSGMYTSDELKRKDGEQYGKYRGFCCETHRYQNGPNISGSPGTITRAGEDFISTTVFKFTF